MSSLRDRHAGNLTEREVDVLERLIVGETNAQIAAHLSVTEQTVKFHLSNVYPKLGVKNRTEAALLFANGKRSIEPSEPKRRHHRLRRFLEAWLDRLDAND